MYSQIDLSYIPYLYSLVVFIGLGLFLESLYRVMTNLYKESEDPGRALIVVWGIRKALVGVSLVGIGIALYWNLSNLFLLFLIFGIQELFETSLVIAALKRAPNTRLQEISLS